MHVLIHSGQSSTAQVSAALATAAYAASTGKRVLMVGSGPSLLTSYLLKQPIETTPKDIAENLAVMELSALDEFDQRWKTLCGEPKVGMSGRVQDIQADEIPSFPSMDEIAAIIVADRAGSLHAFDLLVLGGPMIDSILRGITMREMMRWLVRLISGLDRGPGKSRASQEVSLLPGTVLNTLSSAGLLQDLRVSLERFFLWFDESIGTRVRLVLSDDDMNMPTVRHVLHGFGINSMHVDTIFVRGSGKNKPRPDAIDGTLRETLGSLIVPVALDITPTDVAGWTARGKTLYEHTAGALNLPERDESVTIPPVLTDRKEVRLRIPLLNKNELDIGVASEEVIVRIGQFRRHLLVSGMERGGNLRAKIEGDTLRLWVD